MRWSHIIKTPPSIQHLAWATHGQQVDQETYLLPKHWSLHFYDYKGRIDCGDSSYSLRPGSCSIVPPGMPITFHYVGPSEHLYCHFSLAEGRTDDPYPSEFIPNDARLPQLKNLLAGAITLKRSAPQRANLRLWEVLLGIQDIIEKRDNFQRHECIVETTTEIVMQEMAHPLTIQELASRCHISHNQLTRILKQETGETPAIWLRRLRTDRAKELLTYSNLPIKVIAAEVGYPDLQHFNKVMRQRFGNSPRELRSSVSASASRRKK